MHCSTKGLPKTGFHVRMQSAGFWSTTANIMHNRIYTLVERYPIAVSNSENGDLDGDFDGIAWRDMKMLGVGLVDALASLELMASDACQVKTSLCRDLPGNLVYPAVKISTSCEIPDRLREKINGICFKYAQEIIFKTSHATSHDLIDDILSNVQLTADEEKTLIQSVHKTLLSLPVRLKHPIVIEDHNNESLVRVEGKLGARPPKLVGSPVDREIQGVVDNLGYSDFTARILDLDGVAINGHYSNHSELDKLWKSMRYREVFNFELRDVIDDVGKCTTTIRILPPPEKEQTLR